MTASALPDPLVPVHEDSLPEWTLRPSEYLETLELGDGEYIVWNRFVPVPTLLNEWTMGALRGSAQVLADLSADERAYCRDMFLKKRLAYEGEEDTTRAEFEGKMFAFMDELEHRHTGDEPDPKQQYKVLTLSNDPCNVGCSYCMIPKFNEGAQKLVQLGKKAPPEKPSMSKADKLKAMQQVVDHYVRGKLANGETEMKIGMGGGEMVAQWWLVEGLIDYVTHKYPDIRFIWNMNSSLTLLSEEQAQFMAKHQIQVFTSIDGYKDNHDKYRTYHNGRGTFDDVLSGVELYNKYNTEFPITSFQGTIADPDEFDPNRMSEFVEETGFEKARMSPDLLGVSVEQGEKQADLMVDLYVAGQSGGVPFDDLVFQQFEGIIKRKDKAKFGLFCVAMSNPKSTPHVNVNLTTMSAAVSCSFVPSAGVSLAQVENNIFDPAIWKQNLSFANERVETIKNNCMDCEIVGACHGSCVLSGIDGNNQMNPGGCAYLRRTWRRLTAHLHGRGEHLPSRAPHQLVPDHTEPPRGESEMHG